MPRPSRDRLRPKKLSEGRSAAPRKQTLPHPQTAREGTQTPEQAMEYAEIIRAEHTLSELNSPGSLSDDTIQSLLAAMREQKK